MENRRVFLRAVHVKLISKHTRITGKNFSEVVRDALDKYLGTSDVSEADGINDTSLASVR